MASVVQQTLALDFADRFTLELLPITINTEATETLFGRIRRHVRQLFGLRAAIHSHHSSVVHIHTCSGFSFYRSVLDMLLAQRLGCRVILHIHGAGFDAFYAGEPAWRRRIVAWSLAQADRVIALSSGWAKKLSAISPAARITTIENAVAIPNFARESDSGRPCQFLLLAKMDEWKGIDDLLDACRLLHCDGVSFKLTLAGPPGSAGDAKILTLKIRERSLQGVVDYRGSLLGEEKTETLRQADVYVQPSHQEGMPISLLEALAFGLPVIATRVGAVPEVIEHNRQGLLISPREPAQLAGAMRELASESKRRASMGTEAYQLATRRFGLMRFRDELAAMYGELTARHKSGHYEAFTAPPASDSNTSEPLAVLM